MPNKSSHYVSSYRVLKKECKNGTFDYYLEFEIAQDWYSPTEVFLIKVANRTQDTGAIPIAEEIIERLDRDFNKAFDKLFRKVILGEKAESIQRESEQLLQVSRTQFNR